jgi:hypothetical protein
MHVTWFTKILGLIGFQPIFFLRVVSNQNLPCLSFGKPKLGKKIVMDLARQMWEGWQVLVANQMIAKIMACQIIGLANFESQPIMLSVVTNCETD